MKKRTKLCDRVLPNYSRGEEQMNMITHIVGGSLGICALALCLVRSLQDNNAYGVLASVIYGTCMIALYAVSSIYHGFRPGMAKKVLQVVDHCTIYFLIAGSYTIVALCAFRPVFPVLGWGLFLFEWALTALAVTLTAIDLKKYSVFSMVCYIGMGWAVIFSMPQAMRSLGAQGFALVLGGGLFYTVGVIFFRLGKRIPYFHSVFHLLTLAGSICHALAVMFYVLW